MHIENKISKVKNILLALTDREKQTDELNYLVKNFCGTIAESLTEIKSHHEYIYAFGNISVSVKLLLFPWSQQPCCTHVDIPLVFEVFAVADAGHFAVFVPG